MIRLQSFHLSTSEQFVTIRLIHAAAAAVITLGSTIATATPFGDPVFVSDLWRETGCIMPPKQLTIGDRSRLQQLGDWAKLQVEDTELRASNLVRSLLAMN